MIKGKEKRKRVKEETDRENGKERRKKEYAGTRIS